MDNLTHTMIGFIAGQAAASVRYEPPSSGRRRLSPNERRSLFIAMGMIGGNLPDLDLALLFRSATGKLGYLLFHRGYTHTMIGVLLLAAILFLGAMLWLKRRKLAYSPADRMAILAMALLAVALHLLMDSLNSYGVHAFWPFDDHWFYGDSIFIVEPWYWIAAAPLFFQLRARVSRFLLGLVIAAALVAASVSDQVPWPVVILAAITAGVLLALGRSMRASQAAICSVAACVLITLAGLAAHRAAARAIEQETASLFPSERFIDHALTPLAMTPVCWDVLSLSIAADAYRVRHTALSLAPRWIDARRCGRSLAHATTAERSAPTRTDSAGIAWLGDYAMLRTRLISAVRSDCDARKFMQFARVPFIADAPIASMPFTAHAPFITRGEIIGDLRFDRAPTIEFAELSVRADVPGTHCVLTSPWIAPRGDLLGALPQAP